VSDAGSEGFENTATPSAADVQLGNDDNPGASDLMLVENFR